MSWLSNLGLGGGITIIGSIVVLIGATLSASQQGRDQRKLLDQSEQIARLSLELSNFVTGGDSYCWIMPETDQISNRVTLRLWHHGKYPLRNVYVRIINLIT